MQSRCTLKIKQNGHTSVNASGDCSPDGIIKYMLLPTRNVFCIFASVGKWNNLFTAEMMFTNTGDSDLAITNMEGYYCTTGGWGMLMGVIINCIH